MSKPKITEQEQILLRNSAKAELERLERELSDADTRQLIDDFKNKFNVCESVYKVILAEHQKRKGKPHSDYLKVNMTQVPHALSFAGYNFDKALLAELFGSNGTKGKTVKKLRDAVTHGIDAKAVNEIVDRKDELFGHMDRFLNEIRVFDKTAA